MQPLPYSSPLEVQHFEQLYTQFWKKVFGVCYANVKDTDVAQEMVQEIFLSLWERRHTLQITTSAEHYLTRAAKLKVFEYYRNQTIRRSHLQQITLETSTCHTEYEVEYSNLLEHFRGLLGQLPMQRRQVFGLREQGLSNREIALQLKISVKAVEYHMTKALHFLREALPLDQPAYRRS